MCMSREGGKLKVYSGSQALQSASLKRVPRPSTQSARKLERLFDDLRNQGRALDTPGALHEGAIDFKLGPIPMKVHFLVRVFAVKMAWNIAGDHNHGDAVEGGIRDARRPIGQAGTQV